MTIRKILTGCLLTAWAGAATTVVGGTALTTTQVVTGLQYPVFVTHAPGDYSRIFILEKPGRIRIVKDGVLLATSFLDINAIVGGGTSVSDERGLLGLAFHPDYAGNGYFYVNYTNNANHTVVARYTVSANPDIADPASAQQVFLINQPQTNHNGGWIAFGPDGYLYVSMGDGGGAGDDDTGHTVGVGNGQDITSNLLGKMLRVDVNGDDFPGDNAKNYAIPADNPFVGIDGDDEIWAFGLRNAWRNSFDRVTGDLYIADVGQDAWEEINFQPASSSGGENYGWRCYEGNHNFNQTGDCSRTPFTFPIHEYSHGSGCSISGGYVYRGCAIADLQGTYFFADYCTATIWSFEYDGSMMTNFTNRTTELDPPGTPSITNIVSFGEDAYGEMYVLDQSGGEIYKIVPNVAGGVIIDCNANGQEDACDILDGTSADVNGNGVPDECEPCIGDLNGDLVVDLDDLSALLVNFGQTGIPPSGGDLDGDGDVDLDDLSLMLVHFGETC